MIDRFEGMNIEEKNELVTKEITIRKRLEELSQDFVQSMVGAYFPDLDERKKEFAELHNELRGLLGKTPRSYY